MSLISQSGNFRLFMGQIYEEKGICGCRGEDTDLKFLWFKKNNYDGLFIFEEMKNNLMTKAKEIRLRNLFIKFKNEGKELDEIKGLLEVDSGILEKWNVMFEGWESDMESKFSQFKEAKVVGLKGQDAVFITYEKPDLDEAIDSFKGILNVKDLGEKNENLVTLLETYLFVLETYFINLEIDETRILENVKFNLNTENEAIHELALLTIEYYLSFTNNRGKILIKNTSPDNFKNVSNILPYALKLFKIDGFEGVKKAEFEGLPIDTNWIFLIGENGYGKTTILRSIAIGLNGEKDEEKDLIEKESRIGLEYFSLSRSVINNVGYRLFEQLEHLACYGPSRLQIQTEQTQNDVAKKSTTTYSLFNADGVLLNIEFELLIWFLEKNPRFDSVKQTFLKLIPYLSDIQVDVPKRKVFYIEKEPTENGVKYNPVTFNELASGFRSILAMVGDMMIRLFKSQPDITEPSELAGIVIIDEIDLHWHPKMQREIPALLSSIFPKVQFIASTHSLVPLLGAPENSVLLKVNRTVEEGITVEKMEIDFQALSSDTMLRDIFDLEKYQSDAKLKAWERYKELKRMMREQTDMDLKENYMDERREISNKYNFPA